MAGQFAITCNTALAFAIALYLPRPVIPSCRKADSPIIQTGPGAVMMLGISYGSIIVNLDSLNYVKEDHPNQGSVRMETYFVTNQTGKHEIYGNSSESFYFTIYLLDGKVYSSSTSKSPEYITNLRSGFRYRIIAYFSHRAFCRIGVKFPNGTVSDPIGHPYIYRTFDIYYKGYYLAQLYNARSLESNGDDNHFLWGNPQNFKTNASSYEYRSKIKGSKDGNAIIIFGTFWLSSGNYSFGLSCKSSCIFNTTRYNGLDITSLNSSGDSGVQELSGDYCFSFRFWDEGEVKFYKHFNGSKWETFPSARFLSHHSSDSVVSFGSPLVRTLNVSAISVELRYKASLYPKDRWSPDGRYELSCYEWGKTLVHSTFLWNGSLPKTVVLSGLKNYTTYKCITLHFGSIDGNAEFHVISYYRITTTSSNVPSAAPKNLRGSSLPGSFKIEWDMIPSNHWQGYQNGYNLHYRPVNVLLSWSKILVTGLLYDLNWNIAKEFYEFKVCGLTSAGEGPCSIVIKLRTLFQANQMEETSAITFHTDLRFTHKKLTGHLQVAHQVNSVKECFSKCLDCLEGSGGACACASFNIESLANGGSRICEINTISADNAPQDLITFDGYQYYAVSLPNIPIAGNGAGSDAKFSLAGPLR